MCASDPRVRSRLRPIIGSEGLLGTETLQSCLPHQLDLRTGQLWVDGQSTLQLHQHRQAAQASAHLTNSLVLLPDSEIVAPGVDSFSVGNSAGAVLSH